jgi:dTDP-4-dehydrorhamnose reductase
MFEMRTLILGCHGQLGTALQKVLTGEVLAWSRAELNVTDFAQVPDKLNAAKPDCIINCTAYNLVDKAELEPEVAFQANALAVRALAQWAGANDATLVHVSTDYVFSGRHISSWQVTDVAKPRSVYGVTKLGGEHFAQAYAPKHFVIRTCGLYGPRNVNSGKGTNFIDTMIRMGSEGKPLRVVNDQICTPTNVDDVAVGIVNLLRTEAYGLYHLTASGETTWYNLAVEALKIRGIAADIQPTTTAAYAAGLPKDRPFAYRPEYSVLSNERYTSLGLEPLPSWQDGLGRYLKAAKKA